MNIIHNLIPIPFCFVAILLRFCAGIGLHTHTQLTCPHKHRAACMHPPTTVTSHTNTNKTKKNIHRLKHQPCRMRRRLFFLSSENKIDELKYSKINRCPKLPCQVVGNTCSYKLVYTDAHHTTPLHFIL